MKIVGSNCSEYIDYDTNKPIVRFTANYSDGIIVIYNYRLTNELTGDYHLEFFSMLSTGLSSSYLQTKSWPSEDSIESRTKLAKSWLDTNKNRYKLLKNSRIL